MPSAGGHWSAQGRNWWYVSWVLSSVGSSMGGFLPSSFRVYFAVSLYYSMMDTTIPSQFFTFSYSPENSLLTLLKRTFLSWRMTSEVFINHLKLWLFWINLKISHLSERWYSQIASVERKGAVLCNLSPTIIDTRLSCHVIVLKAITLK